MQFCLILDCQSSKVGIGGEVPGCTHGFEQSKENLRMSLTRMHNQHLRAFKPFSHSCTRSARIDRIEKNLWICGNSDKSQS